ncbi:MAG: hypothetical protein JO114_03385 [Planctomycetaceae bacterium]|nr:hypothetical protein [Planctomycetaceae bacterium]
MDDSVERFDALIRSGARRLTGYQRRLVLAEVATALCGSSARQAERRFGWGRDTVENGLHELPHGVRCLENFAARGRQRSEQKDPQLAADIRAIVEPQTHADPELKSARRSTDLSAAEVRDGLIAKGYSNEELPSARTMRDILKRMNSRLQRIQNGKPLKKGGCPVCETTELAWMVWTTRDAVRWPMPMSQPRRIGLWVWKVGSVTTTARSCTMRSREGISCHTEGTPDFLRQCQ